MIPSRDVSYLLLLCTTVSIRIGLLPLIAAAARRAADEEGEVGETGSSGVGEGESELGERRVGLVTEGEVEREGGCCGEEGGLSEFTIRFNKSSSSLSSCMLKLLSLVDCVSML